MRTHPAYLTFLPLWMGGSLLAHQLDFAIAEPEAGHRHTLLVSTGHAYLWSSGMALACAAGIVMMALGIIVAVARGTGRQPRPWMAAVGAPAMFAVQEIMERALTDEGASLALLSEPTFLPGLMLQAPFALAAWAVALVLMRGATSVRRQWVVGARKPRRPSNHLVAPEEWNTPSRAPRARRIAHLDAGRAPPRNWRPQPRNTHTNKEHFMRRSIAQTIILTAIMIAATTATAAAHVEFVPSTVSGEEAALVTLTVPHDCNGKGTTSIETQVPKDVTVFTPVEAPGWTIVTKESGAEHEMPMGDEAASDEHMKEMHAGGTGGHVDSVTWTHTGGALAHGTAIAFHALVAVNSKATDMIHLPTIQSCPEGQKISWIDTPAKGETMDDLESPSPMLEVDADAAGGHHADEASTDDKADKDDHADDDGDVTAKDAKDAAGSAKTMAIIALVIAVFGLLGGLMTGRRKRS